MDDGLEIVVPKSLDDKDFKENFFYHFDKRETLALFTALIIGGAIYLLAYSCGFNSQITSLLMAAGCILPLLIGFFKKQGFGFIDYMRKKMFVKSFADMTWESTEDATEISSCKGRRLGFEELSKKT